MKRSGLQRRTPRASGNGLARGDKPLRRVVVIGPADARADGSARGKANPPRSAPARAPGKRAWYRFDVYGKCEVCGKRGPRQAHHIVLEQYVTRLAPEKQWDLRNRWLLGLFCCHHDHHHPGVNDTRIPAVRVPARARKFAAELLGEEPAKIYFARRYRP